MKYKKKSTAKGRPRSNHKHIYETVLLHSIIPDYPDKTKKREKLSAHKVCTICGRINGRDTERYERVCCGYIGAIPKFEDRIISPESLEDWYCEGFIAKNAYKLKGSNLTTYRVGFNGDDVTEVDATCEEEAIELAKTVATENGLEFQLDYVEPYDSIEG